MRKIYFILSHGKYFQNTQPGGREDGRTDYSNYISISKYTKKVLNPSSHRTKFPSINKSHLLNWGFHFSSFFVGLKIFFNTSVSEEKDSCSSESLEYSEKGIAFFFIL